MKLVLAVVVGILAVGGVGSSVRHFMVEPYNEGFLAFPVLTAMHVILGGTYLALAPFQFSSRIRKRWPHYHRMAGRLLVAITAILGPTAFFMAVVIPFSGLAEQIIVGSFAVFYTAAIVRGFLYIRAGRMAKHREWMMRGFAIGLGIATMRLMFVPLLIIFGEAEARFFSILTFTLGFAINLSVAEIWIRRTRTSAKPAFTAELARAS